MLIRCNHKGGCALPGLRFRYGKQDVDAALWDKATEAYPALAAAFVKGSKPILEILDGTPPPKPKPKPEKPAGDDDSTRVGATYCPSLAVKVVDATNKIAAMETVAEIDRFVEGEKRKTVLQAASKRRAHLGGG